jgi:hypothetical protein
LPTTACLLLLFIFHPRRFILSNLQGYISSALFSSKSLQRNLNIACFQYVWIQNYRLFSLNGCNNCRHVHCRDCTYMLYALSFLLSACYIFYEFISPLPKWYVNQLMTKHLLTWRELVDRSWENSCGMIVRNCRRDG